jgi:protocatechuate 3,4-dioxygenase beta subunit
MLRAGRWASALVLAMTSLAEAQQSSVTGVVTDGATGQPLEAARVLLTGPNRIEATNQEGRYLFRNVAPGSYAVRVLRLGYRPATDSASVAPGERTRASTTNGASAATFTIAKSASATR